MARDLRALAIVFVGCAGLACADVDVPNRRDGGTSDVALPVEAVPPRICQEDSVFLDPEEADVLILFDRSGSMGMAFGQSTRAEALTSLLSGVLSNYAAHVHFGYEEMPGQQDCDPES